MRSRLGVFGLLISDETPHRSCIQQHTCRKLASHAFDTFEDQPTTIGPGLAPGTVLEIKTQIPWIRYSEALSEWQIRPPGCG